MVVCSEYETAEVGRDAEVSTLKALISVLETLFNFNSKLAISSGNLLMAGIRLF